MQSHLQSSCCFARPRKSVLYASGWQHATPATHGEALRAHGCQLMGHAAHVPHVLAAGKACYPSGNLLVASHAPGNLYCTQVAQHATSADPWGGSQSPGCQQARHAIPLAIILLHCTPRRFFLLHCTPQEICMQVQACYACSSVGHAAHVPHGCQQARHATPLAI